ncbi:hypothetical protein FNV43_RR23897 [Rhamnella rubrinervis]|uniref:Transmembrane protein n=1 Tax=Rhamnella rubrinervis TaxID=2594499 RepID=A0A8K0DS00_9ROSA|nr:hypothetical protein FNV43_RR23897 [Rhamnella rubrinervis]
MALRIKTFLLVFLIVILIPLSSGMVEDLKDGSNLNHYSLHQGTGIRMNSRKLMMADTLLDYDDAGANPKHDPKRKPGGRNL